MWDGNRLIGIAVNDVDVDGEFVAVFESKGSILCGDPVEDDNVAFVDFQFSACAPK